MREGGSPYAQKNRYTKVTHEVTYAHFSAKTASILTKQTSSKSIHCLFYFCKSFRFQIQFSKQAPDCDCLLGGLDNLWALVGTRDIR